MTAGLAETFASKISIINGSGLIAYCVDRVHCLRPGYDFTMIWVFEKSIAQQTRTTHWPSLCVNFSPSWQTHPAAAYLEVCMYVWPVLSEVLLKFNQRRFPCDVCSNICHQEPNVNRANLDQTGNKPLRQCHAHTQHLISHWGSAVNKHIRRHCPAQPSGLGLNRGERQRYLSRLQH